VQQPDRLPPQSGSGTAIEPPYSYPKRSLRRKRNVAKAGLSGPHVPVAVSLAANHEVMAPIVAPTEGDLHHGVQVGKSRVSAHKQVSPDGRFDVVEQHVELIEIDLRRLRRQRAIISELDHDRRRGHTRGVPPVTASGWDLLPPLAPGFFRSRPNPTWLFRPTRTMTSPPTSRQAATNSSRDVMAAFIGRYNDAARKRRSTTGI
jgi:hypothetical protein